MSEASDFPDPLEPIEHSEPNVPFDPAEHFESLTDQPFEPLVDEARLQPAEFDAAPRIAPYVLPSSKPSQPSQPSPARGIGAALIAGSLILGSAVGVAFVAGRQFAPKPPAADASAAKPAAAQADSVKAEIETLSKQLDDVRKQLAAIPKPAPATDLGQIEAKLAAMSKQLDAAPELVDTKGIESKIEKVGNAQFDLIEKLDAVNAKVGGFEKALAAQTTAVAAIEAKLKSVSDAKPNQTPAAVATPAVNADAEFAKGVDLFKKAQFAQAKEQFTKLEKMAPDDARVWYYAAMANGFATNTWIGESQTLVAKGMSLEKAGTPDVAKINATFADLDAGAKGWLDAYRIQIVR